MHCLQTPHLTAVRMNDLQPVVACVGDPFDSDHLLHVVHPPATDDPHKHIGEVCQADQHLLGLLRDGCEVGVRGDRAECAVVVEEQGKDGVVPDVLAEILVEVLQLYRLHLRRQHLLT